MYYYCIIILILFFSGCATVPVKPPVSQVPGVYHIVGTGQTLYRISKTYGVDINEIMRLNNIQDPNQIGVGERLLIPKAQTLLYVQPYRPLVLEPVEKLVGKKQYKIKWKTITLHHSGTKNGNAEIFDRNHRHRGMGGLFYHFVIGNGTGSDDGEIEAGWRWMRQVEVNRHCDIQICLVGNFDNQAVSTAQFNSLTKLLKVLSKQYSIPICNIRTHARIPGKITDCPGSRFPYGKVIAAIRKN